MAAKYQIPFKQDGNHADYAYQWEVLEWRDNYEFTETMQIIEYGRGNSSATFKLCDSLGRVYNCFMSDTFDIIRDDRFAKGYITANFTFVKKGQSYGVKLVQPQIKQ